VKVAAGVAAGGEAEVGAGAGDARFGLEDGLGEVEAGHRL